MILDELGFQPSQTAARRGPQGLYCQPATCSCGGVCRLPSAERRELLRQTITMAPGKIPESVLKKRKRAEDWATKRQATKTEFKNKAKANRKECFQRAEKYVKEYRSQVGCIRRPWFSRQ